MGSDTTLDSRSSEALITSELAHHPRAETKSPGELLNRSITGAYMIAFCYFLCLASGLCLHLGFVSHTVHKVRETSAAEKHRGPTFCCSLGKTPSTEAACWLDLHCAQKCFCNSPADDPSGSPPSFCLEALLGRLLSHALHLVALYQLLLARPKVRTQISARGLRSKFRSYASLCLLATYLAGCCHMGLSLGVQSHPYLEACRYSVHARIPGLNRTRPMNPRLRPEWLALRAPTLAAQKLLIMICFSAGPVSATGAPLW